MYIEDIEQRILNRLQEFAEEFRGSKLSDIAIKPYPETPKDYYLKHVIGETLVIYRGAKYDQFEMLSNYQQGLGTIEILLVFRSLRGHQGLYQYAYLIKKALLGWSSDAFEKLTIESEDLLGEEKGIWQFGMKFNTKVLEMMEQTEEEWSTFQEVNTNG